MSVSIDTTTCRLSNFENGVIAEIARLQCREVELVHQIQQMQAEDGEAEAAGAIAERDLTIADLRAEILALQKTNDTLTVELEIARARAGE